MDDRRFHAVAGALSSPAERRRIVRGLVAAALAVIAYDRRGGRAAAWQSGALNQTGSGFAPGQACVNDFQCDNSYPELGIAYCADNGYVYGAYGGELHCCRYEGGSCGGPLSDDHAICCGSLLCNGGRCG
jgi:hypothetical protein